MKEEYNKSWLLFTNKHQELDKDVFIGPKEFVSHMMMMQTKDRLYHMQSDLKMQRLFRSIKNS